MGESNYELALDHTLSSILELNSKASDASKKSSLMSSCRICLSAIIDPAQLSCGHKFCERCLEKYWDLRDRPDFIVCPLCRGFAFDVDFSKKEPIPSTADFRKTFNGLADISEGFEHQQHRSTLQCIQISLIMPTVYYVVKWLKMPLMKFISYLHLRFARHNASM